MVIDDFFFLLIKQVFVVLRFNLKCIPKYSYIKMMATILDNNQNFLFFDSLKLIYFKRLTKECEMSLQNLALPQKKFTLFCSNVY